MSARQELYDYATVAFKETGIPPVVHAHMTRLLDAFAHELAERIRQEGAYWGEWAAAGKVYRAAADLIDPEKSASPVRPDEEPT